MHWLDGFKALNFEFLKAWVHHPITGSVLLMLLVLVAFRDFILWVCMGDHYLDEED